MSNQNKNIVDEALEKISSGKVTMRSKRYFIWRTLGVVGLLVLAAAVTLFLLSLVLFYLRASGAFVALRAGGVRDFFASVPLWILLVGIVGLLASLALILRFRSVHKRPLVITLGGIFLGMALGSIALAYTPVHGPLFNAAKEGRLPFATPLHRGLANRMVPNTVAGEIIEITDDTFVVADRVRSFMVNISDDTLYPRGEELAIGDAVVVRGALNGDAIIAEVVMKVNGPIKDFHRPRRGQPGPHEILPSPPV